MAQRQFQKKLTKGPGKFDLMTGLFAGTDVFFVLDDGEQITVRIDSIEAEDGSRESWNFKGFVKTMNFWIEGYYSTRGNKGHATFFSHREDMRN